MLFKCESSKSIEDSTYSIGVQNCSSMTITTRSKRVSAFGHAPTPSAVGPGSYAPEKTGTSFKEVHRPLFSGFAASEKRNLNENKTTSAITPGE